MGKSGVSGQSVLALSMAKLALFHPTFKPRRNRLPLGAVLAFGALALSACGVITQESIYEGVRSQEKLKNAGQEILPNKMPPYQDYEVERERLKKGN
jgi:hypothetical protein